MNEIRKSLYINITGAGEIIYLAMPLDFLDTGVMNIIHGVFGNMVSWGFECE